MKKFRISIFTEEYAVNVYIGNRDELIKNGAIYTTYSPKTIRGDFNGRGICYNVYPDKHPLVLVDGNLNFQIQLATLTHEAIHAVDYLMDYIKIDMKESEFRAHAVATILRTILNKIVKTKN